MLTSQTNPTTRLSTVVRACADPTLLTCGRPVVHPRAPFPPRDNLTAQIPATLKQGSYILRAEVIDYLSASQLESCARILCDDC